jgi:hypothetical protein
MVGTRSSAKRGGRTNRESDMDSGGISWGLQTIIGVAILAAVLLWALLHNRRSRADRDRTEQATRELYREEEARRDDEDDRVP